MKDILLLTLGLILGLLVGIAMYWLPLRQFLNECRSIWNLARKRTVWNQKIKIGPGEYRCSVPAYPKYMSNACIAYVYRDEGVAWFFTVNGWVRRRVLHVYFDPANIGPTYLVSHNDILSWKES